jgi:hypothetical protein
MPRHCACNDCDNLSAGASLDLDFYDEFYKPGAYLPTHADHMARWYAAAAYNAHRGASFYAK